jgi:VCBS repeat protein/Big-like domain-containing protein
MKKIFTYLLLFLSSFLFSQAPIVTEVFPSNQEVSAPASGAISVTFDTPIDISIVEGSNFKVFGRWSGPAELTFSLSNNNQTVEMTAFEPLMAGEWVTVILTKEIKSASGENLENAYVWNFWIATEPPAVNGVEFTLIKTIELREPGEGLIQAYGAYAGDLNNDGYSDLTVVNETADDLRILLNDGAGDYSDFQIIPLGMNTSPSPNEGADFNNDGEIDLAVCTAHDDDLRVLFGDGSGTLANMDNYTTGMNARGLGIIELDGDGNDDIVIANRGSSNLTLFQNDGFGGFNSSIEVNSPGEGESGLVVTDFNNDGIQDLIIGMYTSSEIVVMLGDGNMGFTTSAQVPVNGQPWMLGTGDLNGDGFADIVSANSSQNNVAVLLNNGLGGFLSTVYLTENNAIFPLAIDIGDLDGDGDLDLVVSYYESSNYLVFFNNGAGDFSAGPNLNAGAHASCAIIHDRDNDGDLDISGTDEGDDILLLFDNHPGSLANNDLISSSIIVIQPNPFHESLSIEFKEPCADCEVLIYNNLGVLINTISVNQENTIVWKGDSKNGDQINSGVFYLKIGNEVSFEILKAVKLN